MSAATDSRQSNPFPGLRPFGEGEEHLFFGRENQIDAMVDKLADTRFLAVVGTSGSGKSSLFRLLLGFEKPESGTVFLDGWIRRAESSGIKALQQMAKTLAAHRSGLLAYYDVMITSGPMEGTNNKIKTMKRQAYGFRDLEFFKLKILGIHETKYALVG